VERRRARGIHVRTRTTTITLSHKFRLTSVDAQNERCYPLTHDYAFSTASTAGSTAGISTSPEGPPTMAHLYCLLQSWCLERCDPWERVRLHT
jgi:hypothetical protein